MESLKKEMSMRWALKKGQIRAKEGSRHSQGRVEGRAGTEWGVSQRSPRGRVVEGA